jgi:hypothetical protein
MRVHNRVGLGIALVAWVLVSAGCRDHGAFAGSASDALILYEHTDFNGRQLMLGQPCEDLTAEGFNDLASSLKVRAGFKVTLFEDVGQKGPYFTFNCPIGPQTRDGFCEVHNFDDLAVTTPNCSGRPGCHGYWNDKLSSVGAIGPADPSVVGVIASGQL